jgi:hypothetical protein
MDFDKILVALSSSGFVNSQCMYLRVADAKYGYRKISTPGGDWACDRVNLVRLFKWEKSRAKTGSEWRDKEIRDRNFNLSVLAGDAKSDNPSSVIPGRLSNRKDLRDGKDNKVLSLNTAAGNDERCRFSNEGSEAKMSMNNAEFIIPSELQCMTNVLRLYQLLCRLRKSMHCSGGRKFGTSIGVRNSESSERFNLYWGCDEFAEIIQTCS